MLHIQLSNQFEVLLDTLLDRMAAPPASPFVREEIIVPSLAVRRRIELSAADRFGVCANVEFSFLAEWLWRQIGKVVDVAPVSPFKTPVLTWRVFRILGDPPFVRAHPPLAAYLRTADAKMRYDLALRVAALFEQYLTYRSDWLASWMDKKRVSLGDASDARQQDERWQGALWRRIADEIGTGRQHPSVAFFEAIDRMAAESSVADALPAVAHVFCLPALPPLYLSILDRLSRWIELHVYVINPCREHWFEIVDPRRLGHLKVASGVARYEAGHHEIGNRLLASWGKQSKAHIEMLFEETSESSIDDRYVASLRPTLLGRVQNAILDLVDLEPGSFAMAPDDRSIEVHVCHSLTRELEVLQDQLLAVFATDDPPRPSDILVLTPNLKDAAPLIDAVFGTAPRERRIPFAITGTPSSSRNVVARALLAILAVARSRFPASAVVELLQQPVVGRRFGIDPGDLETVHRWVRQSGIRWGLDADQRTGLQLPGIERHTFSDGLDRLFLGYAVPAAMGEPLNGRLPAGNPEGSDALALGNFQRFIDRLERLRALLGEPRTALEWRQVLLEISETFMQPVDDEIDDLREAAERIRELHTNMAQGGAEGAIPADVQIAALQADFDDATRGGTPTGSVTFSSMASLRNLPYRFVFVVGLNDGAFPSASRPDEFDLMALAPRRGDRQRRLDERNLLLDVILATRERLCLSYTGRSIRDNSPLPPSVLLSELLDYVSTACATLPVTPQAIDLARRRLVVEHPLQPFSVRYFVPNGEPRVRSFNDEYRRALSERFGAVQQIALPIPPTAAGASEDFTPDADYEDVVVEDQRQFFRLPLPEPGEEFRDVTLQQLERFFGNPCAYLLKYRLGIDLEQADAELQDDEPFVPEWGDRTQLAQRVLPKLLERDDPGTDAGAGAAAIAAFARAGIEYPSGRLGDIELDRELQMLTQFADRVRADTRAPALGPISETLDIVVAGETWRLCGALGDVRADGLVRHRYDDVRHTEYMAGWIAHLFLNAIAPDGVEARTRWHSRNGHYVLAPVSDARERLAELLALYRDGLRRPLHFFPRSGWKLATTNNFREAYNTWRSSPYRPFGEDRYASYKLALRGITDPLDAEFEQTTATVFGPLLQRITDLRLG